MTVERTRACLRRFSGEERNGSEASSARANGRERLRSGVKWNAAELPESGGFPRRQSVRWAGLGVEVQTRKNEHRNRNGQARTR